MFRTVKNVLPLLAKAVSTAMSSEAVDKVRVYVYAVLVLLT